MEFKTKLEKYKYDNNYSTSEDAFYVDKQPYDTCPMLDVVVSGIDSALDEIYSLENDEEYELASVKRYLKDLVREVEYARDNVEKIRAWGQGWKDCAKKAFEFLEENEIDKIL